MLHFVQEINEKYLEEMIVSHAKKQGAELPKDVARKIVENIGKDVGLLVNEMDKYCAAADYGQITLEIVDRMGVKTVEASVFDMIDLICRKKPVKAIEKVVGVDLPDDQVNKVIDGVKDDDLFGNAKADTELFENLLTNGTIEAGTSNINETLAEIDKMNRGEESSIYGTDTQAAMDNLEEQMKNLMGHLETLTDIQEEIHQSYLEAVDKVGEAFDAQIESYEYVGELIEHNLNLAKLIKGEDAYSDFDAIYDQQEQNNLSTLAAQKDAVDYYRRMMETEEDPEALEKWNVQYVRNLLPRIYEIIEEIVAEEPVFENEVFEDIVVEEPAVIDAPVVASAPVETKKKKAFSFGKKEEIEPEVIKPVSLADLRKNKE